VATPFQAERLADNPRIRIGLPLEETRARVTSNWVRFAELTDLPRLGWQISGQRLRGFDQPDDIKQKIKQTNTRKPVVQ